MKLLDRIKHSWNAFFNKDPTEIIYRDNGLGTYIRPDRARYTRGNERTIVSSIYTRIALDCASIDIKHCRLNKDGRFVEEIDSTLNNCLTVEANKDQTGRGFIQDIVMSMLDEGCVGVVPVDTSSNPFNTLSYDVLTMRTGKIIEWHPDVIKIRLYNESTGLYEEIMLPKSMVAIIENPLYAVMNEPNSTMQRLIHKLKLLDIVDEETSSGKLNIIVQLPYIIKSEARRVQAENRRKEIEQQLEGSKYGIAYTDGTESIHQLSRPLENNLLEQIEFLTDLLYSQLGITKEVMNGTASEEVMLNYYNMTIEPILAAICDEMKRKFLTKTARTQGQSIEYFRDPFRIVPINSIAKIADTFTRNEIMTSNEIRQVIGMVPAKDPKADQLINSNMPQENQTIASNDTLEYNQENLDNMTPEELNKLIDEINQNESDLDELEKEVDGL